MMKLTLIVKLFVISFLLIVLTVLLLQESTRMMIFPSMIPFLIRNNYNNISPQRLSYPSLFNHYNRLKLLSQPSNIDHSSMQQQLDYETTNANANRKKFYDTNYPIRSNSTHIVWYVRNDDTKSTNVANSLIYTTTIIQTIQEAKYDAYEFLRNNIMSFDVPFVQTMGFHDNDDDSNDNENIDGLLDGLIGPVIDIAFTMKQQFLYTDILPKFIFFEYVVNYANVNENRNNIRSILYEELIIPLFMNHTNNNEYYTMADVVRMINANMWRMLAPSRSHNNNDENGYIYFKSSQTPLIFDPMSLLVFGYGSCTGISILLVQALRTAGVPARMCGTNAWNQNISHGNHNWVEIYIPQSISLLSDSNDNNNNDYHRQHVTGVTIDDKYVIGNDYDQNSDNDGIWVFIEGSPNYNATDVNAIDHWDPCRYWICSADRLMNDTQFYSAKLVMKNTNNNNDNNNDDRIVPMYFPLAWDTNNTAVPAINRTWYYHTICLQCQN